MEFSLPLEHSMPFALRRCAGGDIDDDQTDPNFVAPGRLMQINVPHSDAA
jgi:hypothetical protein